MGPARQQAAQIAHVGERFDLVEPCAREKRDEDGVDPDPVVVAADEEPEYKAAVKRAA
jgi:hypothetical protein